MRDASSETLGGQSGREKWRDESFQLRSKEPPGTDSRRVISKNSSGYRLLIGHKKCFVLWCPIGEQFLLSSFREFVHDCSFTKLVRARKLSFSTFLTKNEGTIDESKKRLGCYSRIDSICPENMLFLTHHNVS